MKRQSALYAKLHMSKSACDRWLASPIRFVSDYADWPEMNPLAASAYADLLDNFPRPDFMSVQEFLDQIADLSRDFCCEYDDIENAYIVADANHRADIREIATCVSALRGAEAFKDDDTPSFIFVFPAISGGDPEALLRVSQNTSQFLPPNTDAPDALYFINEAEEFIEALLDEEE